MSKEIQNKKSPWWALLYENMASERISAKTGTSKMGFYPKNDAPGVMAALDEIALQTEAGEALTNETNKVTAVYAKFSQTPPVFTPNEEDGATGYSHSEPGLPLNIYYFHPDHLGSSAYISNAAGVVTQHMEYLPFRETLTDEHTNSFNSPFKYNGKEFDEETGNYYYGARYYDPKWSIFISVDSLAEHPKQIGLSPYSYTSNNPIRYIDPTGMIWDDPEEEKRLNAAINKRVDALKANSSEIQAKIDGGGLSERRLKKYESQLKENSNKMELLDQSLKDVKMISERPEKFILANPIEKSGSHGVTRREDGVIRIEGSDAGLHIHEIRHIGQAIAEWGELKFMKHDGRMKMINPGATLFDKRRNEVNSYQTQYSFDGTYPGPNDSTSAASSLSDINEKSLMNITRGTSTTPVYFQLKDKKE